MNWNRVISRIGPRLFRYFCGSFPSDMASDLTQETLIRLVKKHGEGEFDPEKGSLIMFAYGIARLVRLEAWKAIPPEDPSGDPEEYDKRVVPPGLDGVEVRLRTLRRHIRELNESQQQAILLYVDQELTLQEIGVVMGVPLNTVKSHVHRAKEVLRERLKQDGGDDRA